MPHWSLRPGGHTHSSGPRTRFRDPDGGTLRVVAGDERRADAPAQPDRPGKITHIVLNAPDPAAPSERSLAGKAATVRQLQVASRKALP